MPKAEMIIMARIWGELRSLQLDDIDFALIAAIMFCTTTNMSNVI